MSSNRFSTEKERPENKPKPTNNRNNLGQRVHWTTKWINFEINQQSKCEAEMCRVSDICGAPSKSNASQYDVFFSLLFEQKLSNFFFLWFN